MSKESGGGKKDYLVGYGRPPKATRFQKGQSGNIHGRPRKRPVEAEPVSHDSEIDAILRHELDRKIRLTDRDGIQELKAIEVVQRAQVKKAIEGSPIAQRDILQAGRKLEVREARRAADEEEARRVDFEKTVRWREYRRRLWTESEREGREPDKPWPHPDDILLDQSRLSWRVRGPLYESELPLYLHFEALRDLYLLEAELDARGCSHGPFASHGTYELFWWLYNEQLPLRWQIGSNDERLMLSMSIADTRKIRRLVKQTQDDVKHWHKRAFPLGERIEFEPDIARSLKPHIERLGFGSVREFEEHLERESGNPPLIVERP